MSISSLINDIDQIIRWPKKPSDKSDVVEWLSSKFKFKKIYSEKEVNAIISTHHIFDDTPLLRRELVSKKFLSRKDNGSEYWKIEK